MSYSLIPSEKVYIYMSGSRYACLSFFLYLNVSGKHLPHSTNTKMEAKKSQTRDTSVDVSKMFKNLFRYFQYFC